MPVVVKRGTLGSAWRFVYGLREGQKNGTDLFAYLRGSPAASGRKLPVTTVQLPANSRRLEQTLNRGAMRTPTLAGGGKECCGQLTISFKPNEPPMFFVRIVRDRPDFRVFIDLLYGIGRHVDTDGNAESVTSRNWTELYLCDRESDDPFVEIYEAQGQPGILVVESSNDRLMQLTALYLYLESGSSISVRSQTLSSANIEALADQYRFELDRAKASVWHFSSPQSPYPNNK
ncbi:hypothetical protein J3Q00_14290 [Pseudomonas sp. D2-3]